MFLSQQLSRALEFVFPGQCGACGAPGESPFCGVCADSLVPLGAGCPVCGAPDEDSFRRRRCAHCREKAPPFVFATAPYLHGGALAEAIHRLKYEGREELAGPLALLFEASAVPESDCLCPIPLHPRRLRERGFDQAHLLADGAAKRFRIPVLPLLTRVRATGQQVGRDRSARERNLRGAFTASEKARGLRVCLIDDVLTTGATAAACTLALRRAGASRVHVLTLARTLP